MGAVVATSLAGYLAQFGFSGGWPSIFYTFGAVATFWVLLWLLVVPGTKSKRTIDKDVRKQDEPKNKMPVPWVSILTSVPVMANIVARFAGGFGYLTLQTKLPAYLHDMLHVSITHVISHRFSSLTLLSRNVYRMA